MIFRPGRKGTGLASFLFVAPFCCAIVSPSQVAAQEPSIGITNCEYISEMAMMIMSLRQGGKTITEVMQVPKQIREGAASASGNKEDYEREASALESMIVDAYEIPLFSTEPLKSNTIVEFQNKWATTCFKEGIAQP